RLRSSPPRPAARRELHSLPTRRSSDLVDAVLGVYASAGEAPLDLRWVLKAARHQASAASLYEWLVGVPDEALMALTGLAPRKPEDRKSTRLNSSHVKISYAVFCLKKKS